MSDLTAHILHQTEAFSRYLAPLLAELNSEIAAVVDSEGVTAETLVARYLAFKQFCDAQAKLVATLLDKDGLNRIQGKLLELMLKVGTDSFKTDAGTAYKSRILQGKVTGRDAFLDWCLDNWENSGGEMLQLAAPQVDALRKHLEEAGAPPPGVETSTFVRVNVRAS